MKTVFIVVRIFPNFGPSSVSRVGSLGSNWKSSNSNVHRQNKWKKRQNRCLAELWDTGVENGCQSAGSWKLQLCSSRQIKIRFGLRGTIAKWTFRVLASMLGLVQRKSLWTYSVSCGGKKRRERKRERERKKKKKKRWEKKKKEWQY